MYHVSIKTRTPDPITANIEFDVYSTDSKQADERAQEFLDLLIDNGWVDDDAYVDSVYEIGQ